MLRRLVLAIVFLAVSGRAAMAVPITVDEVLYDSLGVTNAALLSGTVDMTYAGGVLIITLTNTSLDGAGSGAGILLTGIGFQLPAGVTIASGSVNMGTSSAVNFVAPASGNISSEWGYDNNPLNSGAFLNNGSLAYNTAVASMVSMTTTQFASGSLGVPPDLGGPDFGAISLLEGDAGGQEAIRDAVRISLSLSGSTPANLIDLIEAGNVGLSFGSPNVSSIPEPGSLSLLAIGAAFAGVSARRRRKQ